MNFSGDITMCVVPTCPGVFSCHQPGGVALRAFVGKGWARDVPAPLLRPLAPYGLAGRALAEFASFVRRSVDRRVGSAQRAVDYTAHR